MENADLVIIPGAYGIYSPKIVMRHTSHVTLFRSEKEIMMFISELPELQRQVCIEVVDQTTAGLHEVQIRNITV